MQGPEKKEQTGKGLARRFDLKGEKFIRLALIAGFVIGLDQATKAIILAHLPLFEAIEVIPGFFNITHVQNPGGAFGLFAEHSPFLRKFLFLVISSVAAVIVLGFYLNTPKSHPMLANSFALIFGGAVGNLIDRVRFGKVVDFLDFYLGAYHWPAFNVADSAITVGITVFALHILWGRMPE